LGKLLHLIKNQSITCEKIRQGETISCQKLWQGAFLGNVGSTIFFRPGINDIDYVVPYFSPYLTRENVLTLPNYKCIGRLQIHNTLSLPFIFDTVQPK
jgi:hypothetical protein